MPYLAYLDTCIVSGLAKEDIDPEELSALGKLLEQHKTGEVTLVTSQLVEQELAAIPENVRARHKMTYNLLKDIPRSQFFGLVVLRRLELVEVRERILFIQK